MFSRRLLTLSAVILGFGCSDDCHDVPCGATLIVELAPAEGFVDGSYEVTLESAEGTKTCAFTIAGGSSSMQSCSPEGASVDSSELPTFVLVRYTQEAPEALNVAVSLDGSELAREDFTPEYEETIVDSQACGGACTAAQISVEF